MLLECKDGRVLSYYDDNSGVAARPGAVLLSWKQPLSALARFGDPLPNGQPDTRDYAAPPITVDVLTAYASMKQGALAFGGYTMTLAGQALTFETDTVSRSDIMGKFIRLAQPGAPTTISWQFDSGFVSIASADFAKAAAAIADFVQATYDALNTVVAGIKAGTITTLAAIDAAAWPSAVSS